MPILDQEIKIGDLQYHYKYPYGSIFQRIMKGTNGLRIFKSTFYPKNKQLNLTKSLNILTPMATFVDRNQ